MALTGKVKSEQFVVVDDFEMSEIKTKNFVGVMKNFDANKALIVTQGKLANLEKSSKNVPWVKVMRYEGLNVYDILRYEQLFMEQSVIGKLEEALVL